MRDGRWLKVNEMVDEMVDDEMVDDEIDISFHLISSFQTIELLLLFLHYLYYYKMTSLSIIKIRR